MRERTVALLLAALALAGCAGDPPAPAAGSPCSGFAACLFTQDGPLQVVVHRSPDAAFPADGLEVLASQVSALSGRSLAIANGSAIGPLPETVDDAALASFGTGGGPQELHVYVVDALRLEGDEPTAGLSFPGSAVVFLFPATLDLRVEEADLPAARSAQARATLEGVVLVHELGHSLGLVGCGIPMSRPHADAASGCHSSNATSVMQPRVARVAQWPAWGPAEPLGPFGWDADDLADLAAFRAGLPSSF